MKRTVISWQSAGGGVVEFRDDLPGSLRAQPGTIAIMVHEWNLLRRFIRRVEVILV
jgi:hypothetical protein